MGGGAVELEPAGDIDGQLASDFFVASAWHGFSRIMQQQGQMQNKWPFDGLKHFRVFVERRIGGPPNAVELLDAHQRVLIRSVLMIELVLDEARELAEFGNV